MLLLNQMARLAADATPHDLAAFGAALGFLC